MSEKRMVYAEDVIQRIRDMAPEILGGWYNPYIYGSATKITQNLSGMPTASGNGDKIGNAAVDIIEEQTRYREMVKRLTALQNEATKRAYCLVVATECANAIVDFYVNGKTQDQIADETGVSGVDIVRKRINRGCKALAEIWPDFSTV